MAIIEQTFHAILFAWRLWLSCALAGLLGGAVTAGAMIYYVKFKPFAAEKPHRWFLYPAAAGLTAGVMVALASVPPLSAFRLFWLISALVASTFAAIGAAAGVAYHASMTEAGEKDLERQRRRSKRQPQGRLASALVEFDRKLRQLFTPADQREAKPEKKKEFRPAAGKLPTKRQENLAIGIGRINELNPSGSVLQKPRRIVLEPKPPTKERNKAASPSAATRQGA